MKTYNAILSKVFQDFEKVKIKDAIQGVDDYQAFKHKISQKEKPSSSSSLETTGRDEDSDQPIIEASGEGSYYDLKQQEIQADYERAKASLKQLSKEKRKLIDTSKITAPKGKKDRDTQFVKREGVFYFVVDEISIESGLKSEDLETLSREGLQEAKKKKVEEYNVQATKNNISKEKLKQKIIQRYPSLSEGNNPANNPEKPPTDDKKLSKPKDSNLAENEIKNSK